MQEVVAKIALTVPDALHRQAKAVAALRGMSLSAFVAELLESHLARSSAPLVGVLANHATPGGSPAASAADVGGVADGHDA